MTSRPLIVGAVMVLAAAGALLLIVSLLGTPEAGLMRLAVALLLSSAASLLLGAGLIRVVHGRIGSFQLRIALTIGVCLLMALVGMLIAANLMFLDIKDVPLFIVLLAFSAVTALIFGSSVATALMRELTALEGAAARLANGDLEARAGRLGSGEIAHLARSFDAMADRVQAAFERERELDAQRRDLIAAISHDLRTPLATTRAMVEAMADAVLADPNEVRHYAQTIRSEIRHLSRLIDDLFELSRIESGALTMELAPTPLSELVSETVAAYHAQSRGRGIALEHAVELGMPSVMIDPAQMQRVLRNLIDNALHQTPSGGTVRVEAQARESSALVSISDTGPGLASEDVERVFEPFYRGERARQRVADQGVASPGAGLGLAIASRLVQAHGGRLWAEQSSADGAVFRFTLPFAPRA